MLRAASLLCALALAGAGCATSTAGARAEAAGDAPARAPVSMRLPRLGGGELSLATLRGRPVVVTFFTTWCTLCLEEAPRVVRLDERFRPRGLAVLAVALLGEGARPADLVKLYVEDAGFRFPVLLAAPDNLELIGGLGRTQLIPRTVLLDRAGRPLLDHAGRTRFVELEKKILEQLGL
jgi:thiol-disulfide isomerase/thioredoxin